MTNSSFPLRENSRGRTDGSFLAQLVPWDEFEAEYAQQFSPTQGSPAKSFRVALGALIIKERLGTSDEETVELAPRESVFTVLPGVRRIY